MLQVFPSIYKVKKKKKNYNDILIQDTKSYFVNPCQFIHKTKNK